MNSNRLRSFASLAFLASALSSAGCAVSHDNDNAYSDEEDLTSVTARSRALAFDGQVFVRADASDSEVLSAVRTQTKTAFGALRTAQIGVNSRELKEVDPATFVKTVVQVIDTASPTAASKAMMRVRYRYTDNAVVPVSMARRTGLGLAVMAPSYTSQTSRILVECTDNDSEAREFQSSIWYVFNPSLSACKTAMTKEQKQIDADRAKLKDVKTQVTASEVNRLYFPTTVRLGADKTNKGASYPEYDRLYQGGVQKDKLVISLVNGLIDHGEGEPVDDSGYKDWLATMKELFAARSGWAIAKIEPAEELTFTVGGKTYKPTMQDVVSWELGNGPAGMPSAQWSELRKALGKKLIQHWITLEVPVTVQIGAEAPRSFGIQLFTYFGASSDSAPHKRAIKNSDVFLYNGHSYIGFGPLDPSRFTAADFPSSYQILFVDGCVSYNYYEKDYFPLHQGATANLELITNGLEAPSWQSGMALGKFLALLTNGKQASYRDLLAAAGSTDSLRVVDGEVDNKYQPSKTPIVIAAR